jgi:hypothetical protein
VFALVAGWVLLPAFFVSPSGCRRKHPRSFGQARAELRSLAAKQDCGRLFRVLDLKSRWAAMSLLRDARRVEALVKAHYPPERQERALARVRMAATARNAGQWVKRFCMREKLMNQLKDLADKPRKVVSGKKRGHLITSTGRKVNCRQDSYGDWGCDMFTARIVAEQLRMANLVKLTEENVAYYRKAGR